MSELFFSKALARARSRRAVGDLAGALGELRFGLAGSMDYTGSVAAARFLENTVRGKAPADWPVRKVALIGSDSVEFLRPVVRTLAFRDGWWPEFYEAPFGAWRQEILDGNSALRIFQPEVTLVLRGWQAAGLPEHGGDVEYEVERLVREELALAQRAAEGLGIVVWPGFDLPINIINDESRAPAVEFHGKVLAEVNLRLRDGLTPGILWADLATAQTEVGSGWEDRRFWEAARQHPSAAGSVTLVEMWLGLLRARWGAGRKVLVTDLDHTLWGGIVGEDGIDGLRVGPGTLIGEAHAAYQEYLVGLKTRGVLLAVCSKNNPADAAEVFARRPMPLKRDDFVGWMVNWDDKAENLRALSGKLKLGLDSFVFVDDNPAERRRVREALPDVAVPELPVDPAGFVKMLQQRRFFETLSVSAEDLQRHALYSANEQREQMQAGAASVEDFLRGLDMTCKQGAFSENNLERVAQLLTRTNQWNLTTRRHGAAELRALLARPDVITQVFHLLDRFGDNGIVGVWIAIMRSVGEWEIDTWLMSCRVIGRGLEDLMFNSLVEQVRIRGGTRLVGVFRPTAKNALVADLLPRLGFAPAPTNVSENDRIFFLALDGACLRLHHIRQAS